MADDLSPTVDQIRLTTSDGLSLEAESVVPADAHATVVLAHPHPEHGGSMRSLVTSELFRSLPGHGIAAVRFNFRGVEDSEGTYGGGRAEQADVLTAIDTAADLAVDGPLVLAGWSFGADVSLTITDDRLTGWFCIAPPLRVLPIDEMLAAQDDRPKLLAVPEHDEFRLPASAEEATADWSNARIEVVGGAGHFLVGRTDRVTALLVEFVDSLR